MDLEAQESKLTWQEWMHKECDFLDTLDLKPYLELGADLDDIRWRIEDDYGDQYKDEEYIFNCMDSYDFLLYLRNRYPNIFIEEKTITNYIVSWIEPE